MSKSERDAWFVREVLPLEAALMRFLRRHWRTPHEVDDLRQEIYARVYGAAAEARPLLVGAFVFRTARNLLIDKARRAKIVSLDFVAEIETVAIPVDIGGEDRRLTARRELRALEAALGRLPPRCREVVILRKIEGLSQREVAKRMGVTEDTVERQVSKGVRALARALFEDDQGSGAQESETWGNSGKHHGKGS